MQKKSRANSKAARKVRRATQKKQRSRSHSRSSDITIIPSRNMYSRRGSLSLDPAIAREITFGHEILPSRNMYSRRSSMHIDPRLASELTFGHEILPSRNMSSHGTTNVFIVDPDVARKIMSSSTGKLYRLA
jgi:hypothetical protein